MIHLLDLIALKNQESFLIDLAYHNSHLRSTKNDL